MAGEDVGYYTLPVLLSFDGVDRQVNSSLGKALGTAGRRGGADFAKNLSDGIKASEADVKRALDNHAKLADKAADATGKLKVAQTGLQDLIDKGVTSGQRYERALQAREKAMRDEARATKAATDALKDYEEAAKQAQSAGEKASGGFLAGLRGAASGAGGAGSEAASSFAEGFAGSSMLMKLGTKGGPVGAALAAAGLIGGGLLVKNVLAGIEREPARDLIQARLGVDEATMQKVSRAAGRAYAANFGESVQDNLDAGQLAIQGGLVDANDPGLANTIQKLQAVTKLIGGDLSDTTKSASILLRSGLAGSAEEAFDIIARGYQLTGDLGGDWLDSIGEYSSGWKNAGLSATQALALIKQGQDLGVDVTDRSADALREFGRRVSENGDDIVAVLDNIGLDGQAMFEKFKQGGPAGFEAFDAVFDRIRSIEDPVKRNQAAMALLGDTAGDFIGSFTQWDPSEAVEKFGSVDGAAQQASDTMGDNVVDSFDQAKRSIETSVDSVQDKLAEAFGPGLKEVADWVKQHEGDITGFFVTLGKAGIEAAQQVVIFAGDVVGAVGETGAAFGDVVGWVLDGMAAMEDAFGDPAVAQGLREDADAAHSWGEGLLELKDRIKDSASKMDGWQDNLDDVRDSADEAKGKTKDLGDALGDLPKDTKVNLTYTVNDAQGNPVTVPLPPGFGGVPQQTQPPTVGGFPFPGFSPGSGGVGGMGPGGRPKPGSGFLGGLNWDAVAKAESSGNWADNNSGGHSTSSGAPRGGLQITDGTWKAFGGTDFAPTANLATKEEQITVAERIAFSGWQGTAPQGLGAWEAITKGMVPGINVNSQPSGSGMPPVAAGQSVQGTNAAISALAQVAKSQFGLDLTSGKRDWAGTASGKSFHLTGEAGDFSNSSGNSPQQAAFASWLNQNFGPYLQELIYSDPSTPGVSLNAGGPFDYGAKTMGEHQNHVHVAIKEGMQEAVLRALGGGSSVSASTSSALSVSGPVSANLVNAFGAGYEPGVGTPGYDEFGKPGYYETDPRQIAQAERRAEDTRRAIQDADDRIADAKQQRADLEDDLTATAADRAKADREIADAEREAVRAREDAEWAQQDAADARKGKFTSAREASKKKGQDGGLGGLGELGGIAGSFLKETFGIDGSFLPDLSSLMPVQMAGSLLNAFSGPLQGLVDGALGIQQPGWNPTMGDPAATSGAAFGMPNVAAPPMPAAGQHDGSGMSPGPGPGNTTIINAGQTFNGTVGMDPDQLQKQRGDVLNRAVARIPVGQ